MACYFKGKKAPTGCSSWKGKFYEAKVLLIPDDYKSKGVTVMYEEEGDPIEQQVLTSSIKGLMT